MDSATRLSIIIGIFAIMIIAWCYGVNVIGGNRSPEYKSAAQVKTEHINDRISNGYIVKLEDNVIDVLPANIGEYDMAENSKDKIIYLISPGQANSSTGDNLVPFIVPLYLK